MGKKGDNDTRGLADVEAYFNQIRALLKQYRRLVERLDGIKKDKKKSDEKIELLTERDGLKNAWLAKKQACRANIQLLPQSLSILKDKELKDLQEEYREIDSEFKALGLMAERNTLLDGAAERATHRGTGRMNNDELLDSALSTQQGTTNKLKDALTQMEQTKQTGHYTAATLEQDREKIKRIDQGLDEVESELEISKKLITRMVKRMYTDKIIIAFTFLIVAGLVGIIVYATLNPNQKIFNVPDALKPAIPGVTVSNSFTPSPTPTRSAASRRMLRAGSGDPEEEEGGRAGGSAAAARGALLPSGSSTLGGAAGGAAGQQQGGRAQSPGAGHMFHAFSSLARGGSGLRGLWRAKSAATQGLGPSAVMHELEGDVA